MKLEALDLALIAVFGLILLNYISDVGVAAQSTYHTKENFGT